jgi:hypothetical protein
MDLICLRRSAAELAAAAVFELYPNVELLGGADTPTGFLCDLHFPHPVHPDTLKLIEEKMRQIVREARPVKTLEMHIVSAKEFLKKEGHLRRIEELEEEEGELVELIQIGSFHNLSPGPHVKNSAELGAFKMDPIEILGDSEIRLTGYVYPSKQELKDFLKRLQTYVDPIDLGEWVGLWKEIKGTRVWLDKGIALRKTLLSFLKKKLWVGAIEVSGGHHEIIAQKMGVLRVGEIEEEDLILNSFPKEPTSELNSLLQLVEKTLIILGFKFAWNRAALITPSTPAIFEVEDGLGRKWPVVTVEADGKKAISVRVPIEINLSLLLERYSDPKQLMERLEQL